MYFYIQAKIFLLFRNYYLEMFAWRLSISNHICETLQSEFSQINPFICALKVLPREVMENVKIGKCKNILERQQHPIVEPDYILESSLRHTM